MEHHFNVEIAIEHGMEVAVFLNNMSFWIQKNVANNKHFYDDNYWTYNSIEAYQKIFPYLSIRGIRRIIDHCLKNDLLLKGNYNENSHDRTCWYALTKKGLHLFKPLIDLICQKRQMDLAETTNGLGRNDKCIKETYIKPYKKPEREIEREIEKSALSKTSLVFDNGKPKRFSLSAFENKIFDFDKEDLSKMDAFKIKPKDVFRKFILHFSKKSRKNFTENDLKIWVMREIEYKNNKLNNSKFKNQESRMQIRSTVQEWAPGHPGYDSLNNVKPKNKAKAKTS